jgi:alkylated DNA nucleotide flippase Atl1
MIGMDFADLFGGCEYSRVCTGEIDEHAGNTWNSQKPWHQVVTYEQGKTDTGDPAFRRQLQLLRIGSAWRMRSIGLHVA